ncbi:MAG TPA: hypothetical protein VHY33_11170 [Thermoanaerobaculia bacterium]|jgi:hypothetical protein|nr:hypothetical protein [Thermoanaerobaculia bacterium]
MVFIALALFAVPVLAVHHQFHAQVIAIGGDVPSAGAVALAPAGGDGNASIEHYDANGIRFDQAVSSVRGIDDGRVAVTTATITLRNIDILGRIHIDEISARVNGRQNRGAAEAEITFDNLRFKNVVVDGRRIFVVPDAARLNRMRTFAGFRGRDDDALALSANLIANGDQTLEVPGIGTLYFAEVLVKPGERSVTMLRIEFEPQHPMRHLTIGTLDANGTDMYP